MAQKIKVPEGYPGTLIGCFDQSNRVGFIVNRFLKSNLIRPVLCLNKTFLFLVFFPDPVT